MKRGYWLTLLFVSLICGPGPQNRLLASGLIVRNQLTTVDVVRRSKLIFVGEIVAVDHRTASRMAYGHRQRFISTYRVQVRIGRALRGGAQLSKLKAVSPLLWLEKGSTGIPGVWIIVNDHYPGGYSLGSAKRGARIVVYLANHDGVSGKSNARRVGLGHVDALSVLPKVQQILQSGAHLLPPVKRHPHCSTQRPLRLHRKCLSLSELQRGMRCPAGATPRWEESPQSDFLVTCATRDGKRHGRSYQWDPKGHLTYQRHYRNGQRHGEEIAFYENENKTSLFDYRDGKRHGRYRYWAQDGQLRATGSWRVGNRHGRFVLFTPGKGKTVSNTQCYRANRQLWIERDPKMVLKRPCLP